MHRKLIHEIQLKRVRKSVQWMLAAVVILVVTIIISTSVNEGAISTSLNIWNIDLSIIEQELNPWHTLYLMANVYIYSSPCMHLSLGLVPSSQFSEKLWTILWPEVYVQLYFFSSSLHLSWMSFSIEISQTGSLI